MLDSVGLPCDGVELFGERNDLFEGFDRGDPVLDGFLVFNLGRVELRFDSLKHEWTIQIANVWGFAHLDVRLSPRSIWCTGSFGDDSNDDHESNQQDSLLVDNLIP